MSAAEDTIGFLTTLYDRASAKGNKRLAARLAALITALTDELDALQGRLEFLEGRLGEKDRQLEQLRQPKAMR